MLRSKDLLNVVVFKFTLKKWKNKMYTILNTGEIVI